MQIERLFEIVYTLLDRGTVTAQELADKLNVSKRTILRDIETLALAKVPVYTRRAKAAAFLYWMDMFLIKPFFLTKKRNKFFSA